MNKQTALIRLNNLTNSLKIFSLEEVVELIKKANTNNFIKIDGMIESDTKDLLLDAGFKVSPKRDEETLRHETLIGWD